MVIDFRSRPPIADYATFFTPEGTARINKGVGSKGVAPSFLQTSIELFLAEMEEGGITQVVMNGRHTPRTHVSDDTLAQLQRDYAGKFYAFAGVDLAKPNSEILEGIDRAIGELDLKGVCIEPGMNIPARYVDDSKLYPLYTRCADLGVPVLLMSGPFAGPDISYTHPVHYEHVAADFPTMPIILGHGCYPYTTETIALLYKRSNVYCSPDCYLFTPGRDVYVEGINLYPDQFLFGSAYPFRPMPQCVEDADELPIEAEAREKFYRTNAMKLLGIEA